MTTPSTDPPDSAGWSDRWDIRSTSAPSRRALLAGLGPGVVALAGCLDTVVPDSFEATPYGLAAAAARGSGYSQAEHQARDITRDVPIAGSVSITSHLVAYRGEDEEPQPVGVLSSPEARAFGEARNPLAGRSAGELLRNPGSSAIIGELVGSLELLPEAFEGWQRTPSLAGEAPATRLIDQRTVPKLFRCQVQSHAILLVASRVTIGGDIVLAVTGQSRPLDDDQTVAEAIPDETIEATGSAAGDTFAAIEEIDPRRDVIPVDDSGGDSGGDDDSDAGSDDGLDVCVDTILSNVAEYVTVICYDEEPTAKEMAEWMSDAMGKRVDIAAEEVKDEDGSTPAGKTISRSHSSVLIIAIVTPCHEDLDADTEKNQTQGHAPGFTTEGAKQLHRHELAHTAGYYLSWALLRCLDEGDRIPLGSNSDPSFNDRLHDAIGVGTNPRRQEDPDPISEFVEAAAEAAVKEIVQEIDGVSRANVEGCLDQLCSGGD